MRARRQSNYRGLTNLGQRSQKTKQDTIVSAHLLDRLLGWLEPAKDAPFDLAMPAAERSLRLARKT